MTTAPQTQPVPPTTDAVAPPAADGPPRSRWPWFVQCLVAVALLVVASSAPLMFAFLPALRDLDRPDAPIGPAVGASVGIQALVLVLAVAGVALVARLDGGRRLRDLGWRWNRRSLPALGLGVLVSALILVAVGVPLTSAGLLRLDDPGIGNEPLWAVLVIGLFRAFVLQGIPEELIFRGYLLTSLRMRPVRAVLVSGLVFGALHLISSGGQQGWGERIMYLALPTGFGFAAGALMLTTRSLWAAVGIHGGLHLTLLGFALLPRTTLSLPFGDGPALWLLAGLAWTLVAVALMVRLARRGELTR
jgi:membrane protease YdiL (CAAX protease family)